MTRTLTGYTVSKTRFDQRAALTEGAYSGAPRIGYWMFNFDPKWEAASKELDALATAFRPVYGTRTISVNVDKRATTFFGPDKHLPAALALPALPLLMRAARSVPVNHIFASAGERILLPRLARLGNCILTVTKGTPALRAIERNIVALSKLRYVVVESERHYDLLMQLGLSPDRVRLIYPGLEREPYRRARGPFTVLFATSPKQHDLLTRGIYLIMAAAERLPSIRFRLIWRWNPDEARKLIRERRLDNVDLVAGYVEDMKAMYDAAHTVILPALEADSFKPCPHSGLHSLAHGKPVLASRSASIAGIVERTQCGMVFEPTVDSLCKAVTQLAANYDDYQVNAFRTLERKFSKSGFIERYGKLYQSLLV
jgi:glycosyltransferase involved in cell wall biosynthesis